MVMLDLAPGSELNVFEIEGSEEANRQMPAFGRGRIDHIGLHAADTDGFAEIRERPIGAGSSGRIATDVGRKLSGFYHDPDGTEGEVRLANPDADPDDLRFGTPSARSPEPARTRLARGSDRRIV